MLTIGVRFEWGLVTSISAVDRLAEPALGRPVDVEGHLEGDRRRVQGARPRSRSVLGLVGPARVLGRRRPSPRSRRPRAFSLA